MLLSKYPRPLTISSHTHSHNSVCCDAVTNQRPIHTTSAISKPTISQGKQTYHHNTLRTRQLNSIENATINSIPPAGSNITTINRQPVMMSPRLIQLPNPIHAQRIVISRLHFLLLIHICAVDSGELTSEDFGAGQAVLADGGLLDVVCVVVAIGVIAGVWIRVWVWVWVIIVLRGLGLVVLVWVGLGWVARVSGVGLLVNERNGWLDLWRSLWLARVVFCWHRGLMMGMQK